MLRSCPWPPAAPLALAVLLALLAFSCQTVPPAAPAPEPLPPQEIDAPVAGQPPPEPAPAVEHAIVTASRLNLREGPGTDRRVVGKVRRGDRLTLRGADGEWAQVELEDGATGWVHARYIEKAAPCLPDAPAQFLATPPLDLSATGAGGRVVVQLHVSAEGEILSAKVIEDTAGSPDKTQQALSEARQFAFVAPVRGCRRVPFRYNYTRSF